jgi:ParB family chromosome partitioning protein
MDNVLTIVPFRDRRYAEIPIDKIKVINSRNRDQEQFEMNVNSIGNVGLLKPIRVNDKFLERTGMYELVCGEGRLLAHQKLGHPTVVAEVVTCTRREAHLQSLVENLARTKPDTMDHARKLKRLHDEGWDFKQIASISGGKDEGYVRDYVRLVEQGEDRLIRGVEQGVFPIKFAVKVAASDDSQIQHVLMDAFDAGLVTTANFAQARKIISTRAREHKQRQATAAVKYTVGQLQQDIVDATKAKASYVREAQTKENRFLTLLAGINTVWQDEGLLQVLREEKLLQRPDLAGDFRYEA